MLARPRQKIERQIVAASRTTIRADPGLDTLVHAFRRAADARLRGKRPSPRIGHACVLPSGRAAVDRVVGACDVRRRVRSEEGRELCDLLGLTEALEKRLFGDRVPGRLVVAKVAVGGRVRKGRGLIATARIP